MQIEKRRLKCRRFLIFCTKVRGEGSAIGAARGKGGDSLSKENLPLWTPQEKGRGRFDFAPCTP